LEMKTTIKRSSALITAALFFFAIRVVATAAIFSLSHGREVSSDSRFYFYLSEHFFAVFTGENLRGPDYDAAVLTNYGPLMGPFVGPPLSLVRRYVADFFALRAFLVAWEALGLGAAYLVLRRGRSFSAAGAYPLSGAYRRAFVVLAAALPLGWMSTAVWPQDEILLAPFVFFAFVAAIRDRPAAAALALVLGAWGSKYFALAFAPAAWLTCRSRRRFLAWFALGTLPLVVYASYMKAAHGVLPFVAYDTGDVLRFTLSVFSLYGYTGSWWGFATSAPWLAVVSKVILVGAIIGVTARFYFRRRGGGARLEDDIRVWVAFAAALLLFNIMGQPEYLAWFAYLGPFVLVVLFRGRRLVVAAAGLVALVFAGWVWNVAAAVATWSVSSAGDARFAFAHDVTASVGAGSVTAVEVGAATIYVAALGYVMFAALRRPRQTRVDHVDFKPVAGLCSARK
jgi:hypothetical protein